MRGVDGRRRRLPQSAGVPCGRARRVCTWSAGGVCLILALAGRPAAAQESYYAVSVTPDGLAVTASEGATSYSFTVKNDGNVSDFYDLVATCTGAATACTPSVSFVGMSKGASKTVTVNYTASAPGSTGTVRLKATSRGDLSWDDGWVNVTVTAAVNYGVTVTASVGAATVRPSSANAASFVVKNTGSNTQRFALVPTCTAAAAYGACVATPDTVDLASGASATSSLDYGAVPDAGSTGGVSLRATRVGGSETSSASTSVTVGTYSTAVVVVDTVNPGEAFEREHCLTINVGPSAAYECGDLRIVHGLPAVRTMNKSRAPALLYNSQLAEPAPLVSGNVTMPGSTLASSVEARVLIGGQQYGLATWPGSDWGSIGAVRRIVVAVSSALASGIHDYTLEVSFVSADGTRSVYTAPGRLAVVNRQNSYFGAGWWLAGLEQLNPGSMVWTGGDGSVRQYRMVTPSVWASANLAVPDTLKWDGTHYMRYLPGGVQVRFNAVGQHAQTVNRLGHVTAFGYDTVGRLTSIRVPVPDTVTTPRVYRFTYDAGGKLQYAYAPGPNGDRVTTLTTSGGDVTVIREPDGASVSFGYGPTAGPHRIESRTDRRGKVTRFAYGAGRKLVRSARGPGGNADSVILRVVPAETRGLAGAPFGAAQALTGVYTHIDGPRDVADTTLLWVNRFGVPTAIRNALGFQTSISYGDARWPLLATRVEHPNGRVTVAAYTDRGMPLHQTDLSWVQNGRAATARYEWDAKWDLATRLRTPLGVTTRSGYDALTGNRLWQEDGRGASSRVNFRYYSDARAYGLLRAVEAPGALRDSVVYDADTALGNLSATRAPSGAWTYFTNDAVGRPTAVRKPIDIAGTLFESDTIAYDAADRVTRLVNFGPAVDTFPARKVVVQTSYNAEGQVDSLKRWSDPDATQIGVIKTSWFYDDIGRVVAEVAPDGEVDSTYYDPAGNVVTQRNRRRHSLTMVYDELGRLRKRRVPEARYCARRQGIPVLRELEGRSDTVSYPRYPNNTCNGLTIPADSALFTYDGTGNLLSADNRDARIKRSYHPNGLLKTDTLRIRTVAEGSDSASFAQHEYALEYLYDLDGRRTDLVHPAQLARGTGRDRTRYTYHSQLGALETAADLMGHVFTYGYDAVGRTSSLTLPGGVSEGYGYESGGRLGLHTVYRQSSASYLRETSFQYDGRDKVTWAGNRAGTADTLVTKYSGLGHLTYSWFRSRHPASNGSTVMYTVTENYDYDALANFRYSKATTEQSGFSSSTRQRSQAYAAQVGRLAREWGSSSGVIDTFYYDAAGNTEFTTQTAQSSGSGPFADRASFYGADGTLRAADARQLAGVEIAYLGTVYEEYRYDALGRRVLVRVRRWCENDPDGYNGECRISKIKRIVWDGDQELWEIQMPGQDGSVYLESDTATVLLSSVTNTKKADPNPFFGRVAYTHGAALDQPLSIVRIGYADLIDDSNVEREYRTVPAFSIMPLWASNGQADNGVFGDGATRKCETLNGALRCVYIQWPAMFYAYARQSIRRTAWHGSLVEDKKDGAGTFYRRNRLYDPATGRFTQEDPIGLAGGINLYGYANGDPVSYSDPFGLCPKDMGGDGKTTHLSDCPRGSLGHSKWTSGAIVTAPDQFDLFLLVRSAVSVGARGTVAFAGRKLTAWGWTGGPKHKAAVRQLAEKSTTPVTYRSVQGRVPTKEEAIELIEDGGGTVKEISEAGHAIEGVSTHTYPHINYTTKWGTKATVQIQQP